MFELNKNDNEYTKHDIVSILKADLSPELSEISKIASNIKNLNPKKQSFSAQIICISTNCEKNCLYCVKRRSNENFIRTKLSQNEILTAVKESYQRGFNSVILQGGEDSTIDLNEIIDLVKLLKKNVEIDILLELGEKTELEYRKLYEAGVSGYILNHETSDPILYRQIHPDLKYSDRIKCLRTIKKVGMRTGSGIIVGLPGQTLESIANDILLFKELEIDIINIIPYNPFPNTPLARKFDQIGGYFVPALGYFNIDKMIYKIMAAARIVNHNAIIPGYYSYSVQNNLNKFEESLKYGVDALVTRVDKEYEKLTPAKDLLKIFFKSK